MELVIDLTEEPRAADNEDRLTQLPSELLYLIFDILFATHNPLKAFEGPASVPDRLLDLDRFPKRPPKPCSHDLDHLAATCKPLRSQINDWAIHFMLQHKAITKFKQPANPKKAAKTFNALRGKGGLLTWSHTHCIFCGKPSRRSAILMNGLRCCAPCDKIHWPDKITKTQARIIYHVSEDQLLPQHHPHSKLLQKHASNFPHGFPRIWYGTYVAASVPTTMFLEKDVKWLAALYHGDLEAHLAKREAAKQERRQKKLVASLKTKAVSAGQIAESWNGGTVAYYISSDDE